MELVVGRESVAQGAGIAAPARSVEVRGKRILSGVGSFYMAIPAHVAAVQGRLRVMDRVPTSPFPCRFNLLGQEITVEYSASLMDKEDAKGIALYRENKIVLQNDTPGIFRSEDQVMAIFYHEMVHWILHMMNDEKRDDEKFVDLFSGFLHQALSTLKVSNQGVEA